MTETDDTGPTRLNVKPLTGDEVHLTGSPMPYRYAIPGAYSDNDEDSPYHWWLEYLRRNERYQDCCRNGGKGNLSEFYAEWGDVNPSDFDTWFPYEHLFGERGFAQEVTTKGDLGNLDLTKSVVLVCPKTVEGLPLSPKAIRTLFETYLKAYTAEDDRSHWSSARYRIVGNPDPKVLKERLAVYDARKDSPTKSFWRIGADLIREGKISIGKRLVKDIENDITNQAKLELQIFKFHKLAALHIANAIGREFPSEVLVNASNNAVEAKD